MRARAFTAFVLGLAIGLLIPALLAYGYFRFGYAPVATAAPPIPFERTAARLALRARITREAPKSVPIQADAQNLAAGARIYRDNCAMCHGQPDQPSSAIAAGMYPSPPHLFDDPVTDDPVGMTYWKVANGIRMTGMPSFRDSLSDRELWQVSVMLASADRLPQPAHTILTESPAGHPASGEGTESESNGRISPHRADRQR